MNMNALKFKLGDENHVVVEDLSMREDSLFSSQYAYALGEIKRALLSGGEDDKNIELGNSFGNLSEVVPNNVFAFVGNRGSGKSSCMLSVASMLGKEGIAKKKCEVVDVIDPSFFDENVNILDIVIGKMFASFKRRLEEDSVAELKKGFEDNKRNLYKAFQDVKDSLCSIEHKNDFSEEPIERLTDLAASVDLQNHIRDLVSGYLKFFEKDVLVLPIDDIDLHTRCAYTMVEQVRKYLVQAKVIVLVAVKMEQLKNVIENEYRKEYQYSLSERLIPQETISDMAARYLIKFVPQEHRIFMPDMAVYLDRAVELYDGNNRVYPNQGSSEALKYIIAKLIFRKTRYLFYHRKGVSSPIVPRNLREIRHLISMLYRMPDYWADGIKHDDNKYVFKHFLFETWVPNNLDLDGRESISKLTESNDPSVFNKTVLLDLSKRFNSHLSNPDDWLSAILDGKNASYNISVGDVFSVLDFLKKRNVSKYDSNYLFAIETIYSMKLYEYYDLMTEPNLNVVVNSVDETIKQRSMFDEAQPYHILVGGSFVNTTIFDVMTKEQGVLTRSIKSVKLPDWKVWLENETENIDTSHLHALEILALFLSRRDYKKVKERDTGANYRTSKTVVYKEAFNNVKNVLFDVCSIFYNITDVRNAYQRINPKLYDWAVENESSILNKFKSLAVDEREADAQDIKDIEHKLLSWECIRNAEILQDFTEYLCNNSSQGSGWMVNFRDYLSRVKSYDIKTYDKEKGNPYVISFNYVQTVIDALDNEEVATLLSAMIEDVEESRYLVKFLSSTEIVAIASKLDSVSPNKHGKYSSSKVLKCLLESIPNFDTDLFLTKFPSKKAFSKEDIILRLNSLMNQ